LIGIGAGVIAGSISLGGFGIDGRLKLLSSLLDVTQRLHIVLSPVPSASFAAVLVLLRVAVALGFPPEIGYCRRKT
jgi:hypothetical protein